MYITTGKDLRESEIIRHLCRGTFKHALLGMEYKVFLTKKAKFMKYPTCSGKCIVIYCIYIKHCFS
jgi:hypothetical protein